VFCELCVRLFSFYINFTHNRKVAIEDSISLVFLCELCELCVRLFIPSTQNFTQSCKDEKDSERAEHTEETGDIDCTESEKTDLPAAAFTPHPFEGVLYFQIPFR